MKRRLATLTLSLVLLVVPTAMAGCVIAGNVQVADSGSAEHQSLHSEPKALDTVLSIAAADEPEVAEIKTIRIDSTVGLYYVPPKADVDGELELMGATVIDHGPLYEAMVEGSQKTASPASCPAAR